MEKEKACEIIDTILGLFDRINLTHKYDDISGILSEMKTGLESNLNSIIRFIGYIRELETDNIEYNIKLHAAEDVMNKLLNIILRDTNNLTMKDYDAIHSGVISIKNDILKECPMMEKKEACTIIDNIISLLENIDHCEATGVAKALVLSETKAVLKISTNQITRFIEYLKSLETKRVEDNVDTYIVQTIMYDILKRIEEDGDKLTIEDFEDIHDSLMNINENFLHKEDKGKNQTIFVLNPSTMSLIEATKLHSKTNNIANNVEKMNIISKLRKKTGNLLLSYISQSDIQSSEQRIIINSNDFNDSFKIYEKIIDIYRKRKLPMGDLLNKIEIRGLTINQIVSLYAKLYQIEDDVVVHITKDYIINLAYVGNKI